jgi:hypothetical protein
MYTTVTKSAEHLLEGSSNRILDVVLSRPAILGKQITLRALIDLIQLPIIIMEDGHLHRVLIDLARSHFGIGACLLDEAGSGLPLLLPPVSVLTVLYNKFSHCLNSWSDQSVISTKIVTNPSSDIKLCCPPRYAVKR